MKRSLETVIDWLMGFWFGVISTAYWKPGEAQRFTWWLENRLITWETLGKFCFALILMGISVIAIFLIWDWFTKTEPDPTPKDQA